MDFCPFSCINALLAYPNQVMGHYSFFCIAKETQVPLVGLRIFGTHGEIYLENSGCGYVNFTTKDGGRQAIAYTPNEGYYNELDNFYEAMRNNSQIISTPDKALGDMKVIFEILKSAESHAVDI